MNEIVQLRHIIKIYPPNVVAVDDVSVSFFEGEIHSLVGENGAGKSTLVKILCASEKQDSGEILYQNEQVNFKEPGEAIASGIGMLHQEILLIPEYTVWENIVLGVEPTGFAGHLDRRKARDTVEKKIQEFGFNLDKDRLVSDLSLAAKQKVEILKLLYREVRVLILDEPTSILTPQEIPQLFKELDRLKQQDHTIIYISHHLDEVMEISDRITVLRRGKKVATVEKAGTNKRDLAHMMVGREMFFTSKRKPQKRGELIFDIRDLCHQRDGGKLALDQINLQVHANEIVGIAGVEGNGQSELVSCIMGLLRPSSGEMRIHGEKINDWPILKRRERISFVPQDRGKMGASINATIIENTIMTHHRLNPRLTSWNGLVLNARQSRNFTDEIRNAYSVVMDSADNLFRSLSGGNQQKIVLGRELSLTGELILLEQPTRGLDVGSTEFVHEIMLDLRQKNRGILLISSDLDELFMVADRILVMYRGRIVANLVAENTTISEVGSYMLQGQLS